MGEFVGEDALQLVVVEQLHQLRREDNHAGALSPDGEGVGHAHAGDHQARFLDAHVTGEPAYLLVNLGVLLLREVLGADAAQGRSLADLVLEAD